MIPSKPGLLLVPATCCGQGEGVGHNLTARLHHRGNEAMLDTPWGSFFSWARKFWFQMLSKGSLSCYIPRWHFWETHFYFTCSFSGLTSYRMSTKWFYGVCVWTFLAGPRLTPVAPATVPCAAPTPSMTCFSWEQKRDLWEILSWTFLPWEVKILNCADFCCCSVGHRAGSLLTSSNAQKELNK